MKNLLLLIAMIALTHYMGVEKKDGARSVASQNELTAEQYCSGYQEILETIKLNTASHKAISLRHKTCIENYIESVVVLGDESES